VTRTKRPHTTPPADHERAGTNTTPELPESECTMPSLTTPPNDSASAKRASSQKLGWRDDERFDDVWDSTPARPPTEYELAIEKAKGDLRAQERWLAKLTKCAAEQLCTACEHSPTEAGKMRCDRCEAAAEERKRYRAANDRQKAVVHATH